VTKKDLREIQKGNEGSGTVFDLNTIPPLDLHRCLESIDGHQADPADMVSGSGLRNQGKGQQDEEEKGGKRGKTEENKSPLHIDSPISKTDDFKVRD